MPVIDTIKDDLIGNYKITFSPRTDSYRGQMLSEFQLFRRFGNLPHNNVLANKLISELGRNLLSLEKEIAGNSEKPSNLARNKYLNLEAESNSFHISVIEALTPLEKSRTGGGNTFAPPMNESSKIGTLYENRIKELNRLKTDDPVYNSRIDKLVRQIESNSKTTLALLISKNANLQTVYRKVLDDFATEQRLISIFQHRADRPLDYANRSLTEAYQNASYAMEMHVYSQKKPTDKQLWVVDDTQAIVLETGNQPSLRKEDALYTACMIGSVGTLDETIAAHKKKISDNTLVTKGRKKNELLARSPQDEEKRMLNKPTKPSQAEFDKLIGTLKIEAKNEDKKADSPAKTIGLQPEDPLNLFHSNDVFSSIGLACVDFGKYFEGQMAAKKPVMSAAMFLASAVTFGIAGLQSAGVGGMKAASMALAKVLTVGGKLGITPHQLHSIIHAISHEWLELAGTKGNLMRTLIMDGFALPKLNYALIDDLISSSEHKDTFTQLAKQFGSQDLAGYTDKEKTQQVIRDIFVVALMLGTTIALGTLAGELNQLGGIPGDIGSAITTIIENLDDELKKTPIPILSANIVSLVALSLTLTLVRSLLVVEKGS